MNKGWFQVIIDLHLRNLSGYITLLEDSLFNKLEGFNSWAEKEASKLTKEDQEEFYSFYSDDHWKFSEIFPNTLRCSFFVTCYSLLEYELDNLCKYIQKQHEYSIKLEDFRERKILRSQIYLKKVVGMNFPDQSSQWRDIIIYSHIRNFIVHNDGRLNAKQAKTVEPFTTRASISLDNLGRIQISKDFCTEVIDTLRNFFDELFKDNQLSSLLSLGTRHKKMI